MVVMVSSAMRRRLTAALALARGFLRGYPGVRIERGVRLRGGGHFEIAPGAVIRAGAHIWVAPGAVLNIGARSSVGARCSINVMSRVSIGQDSAVSWDCEIMDTDFHQITKPDGTRPQRDLPISIGDRVLVGARVLILKGVTLGDGAIVGAGSVLSRDVPSGRVAAGNPAREVGQAASWER